METPKIRLLIDKSSPIPIYHQISTGLRNRIMNGEWKVNEALPSELELSHTYDVSRVTIRQALSDLEQDGIIKKVRGKGTFIQKIPKPIIHDFNLLPTLWGRTEKTDPTFDAKVLESSTCDPIPFINHILHVPAEENLVFFKRLFLQDGLPIALNRSWISAKLVPDIVELGLIDNHLSTTLSSRYNLIPAHIENVIEASFPTTPDIQILKVIYDTPMMVVSSTSFLPENRPLEYSITSWVGGRVKFHFNMEAT